jgi:protoporphyrinogen oxidase
MIGVVGGGIAGLAAAYRLRQAGREVQVFEASDSVGGLAATYETAGDRIEKFYHHLSKNEQTIVKLAEELDLGEAVEWQIGKNAYYVEGVEHSLDTVWQIAAYPYLSVYDKFRLGMLTKEIDIRGGIPAFDTYEDLREFERVPIREFLLDHTTHGVYEYFFEPLLDAKFGDRKNDVSAAWLLGRIKFRSERDLLRGEELGYFKGGFGRLLDALVGAVGTEHIKTNTPVTTLSYADRVQSLAVETEAGVETHAVDDVIVATMPNVLEGLTGYECDVEFQGSVCAVVGLSESLMDTYWLNIADNAPFGALIEHTNFVPPRRYGGEHLLYVASYVQDTNAELWQLADSEIRELWLDGIADLYPAFDRSAVNWMEIARNPRTAPIYSRGYLDRVVPYDLTDDVTPGLYYAGMASRAQYPERSLNGGVVAGYECADRIIERGVE